MRHPANIFSTLNSDFFVCNIDTKERDSLTNLTLEKHNAYQY